MCGATRRHREGKEDRVLLLRRGVGDLDRTAAQAPANQQMQQVPAFGREATGQPGRPAAPGMLAYGPAPPRLETGAAPAGSPFGHADVGENGTESRASAYSAALYGSDKLTDDLVIDALLGGGGLDFYSTRFVAADGSLAAGAGYRTRFGGAGNADGVFGAILGVTF